MKERTKVETKRKPKILIYDLEVSPELSWTYPPEWQTSVIRMEDRQKLMSFSWKWYGENSINHMNLSQMASFRARPQDDKQLTAELHTVMGQADIIMGHNSASFDDKMANMFFVVNDFDPLPPFKVIDTKRIACQFFRMPSNKLDNLARFFGIDGKTNTRIGDIWYEAYVEADSEAYELLEVYNNQDVNITEQIYEKLRPFMRNHPNLARITGEWDSCPVCGGYSYRVKAYRHTNVSKYQQYFCNDCRHYFSDRVAVKEDVTQKPKFVVA